MSIPPARRTSAVAAFALVALLGVAGCVDDQEPRAPDETATPSADDDRPTPSRDAGTDDPDLGQDGGAGPDADAGNDVDVDGGEALPGSSDELQRPASWPVALGWPPVSGQVDDYVSVADGSVRLDVALPDADPRRLTSRWVAELEEAAHAVDRTDAWQGPTGESVVVAQHPDQVIETRVARERAGGPVEVQMVLTPLGG